VVPAESSILSSLYAPSPPCLAAASTTMPSRAFVVSSLMARFSRCLLLLLLLQAL
jgi:membrane protein YqaA with SNARE-associated domain